MEKKRGEITFCASETPLDGLSFSSYVCKKPVEQVKKDSFTQERNNPTPLMVRVCTNGTLLETDYSFE